MKYNHDTNRGRMGSRHRERKGGRGQWELKMCLHLKPRYVFFFLFFIKLMTIYRSNYNCVSNRERDRGPPTQSYLCKLSYSIITTTL